MTTTPQLIHGEGRVEINGVAHWYKIAGEERATIPLVIIHGGPGGHVYNFERTIGPQAALTKPMTSAARPRASNCAGSTKRSTAR